MPAVPPLRLGVNIDHVATIRNARGGELPDPVRAALLAIEAGADGITAHLREDRRHIRDDDIARLMAAIVEAAQFRDGGDRRNDRDRDTEPSRTRPASCRKSAPSARPKAASMSSANKSQIRDTTAELKAAGIRVSLFIAADPAQIEAAKEVGAPVIEIHTGAWCEALAQGHRKEADARMASASSTASSRAKALGLEVHAGHGLDYATAEADRGLAADRRTQYRAFPGRRGGVRRPCGNDQARCARAMERGRRKARSRHDPRYRLRPVRHPAHRKGARAPRRAIHQSRLHRRRAQAAPSARRAGSKPTPSGLPPRRPARRRSAPDFAAAFSFAISASSILPSGRPTMTADRRRAGATARRSRRKDSRRASMSA